MKVGDLVRFNIVGPGRDMIGQVFRIDSEHYGSSQSFKYTNSMPRGHCIDITKPTSYVPVQTKEGINDRVLVFWSCGVGWEYCKSNEISVIGKTEEMNDSDSN